MNITSCSAGNGVPVLPPSQNFQCGASTLNETTLAKCCNGNPIKQYNSCIMYCEVNDSQDFSPCAKSQDGSARVDAFCQRGLNNTIIESVTKSGSSAKSTKTSGSSRASLPRLSTLLLALLACALMHISPVSGMIVSSVDEDRALLRRESSCSFSQDTHYTTVTNTIRVSPDFACSADPCVQGGDIGTGMTSNNRTVNGTDAASADYDDFFGVLESSTGRKWPAMSGFSMYYLWTADEGSTTSLGFTPTHYCVNGTVANCKGVLGDSDEKTPLTACGPLFRQEDGKDTEYIEGTFHPIVSS